MANENNRKSKERNYCRVEKKFSGAKIRFPAGPWSDHEPLLNKSHHLSAV